MFFEDPSLAKFFLPKYKCCYLYHLIRKIYLFYQLLIKLCQNREQMEVSISIENPH